MIPHLPGKHALVSRIVRRIQLINLVLLPQARGTLTASELARELEVSERTVYRDVVALSAAGVPV